MKKHTLVISTLVIALALVAVIKGPLKAMEAAEEDEVIAELPVGRTANSAKKTTTADQQPDDEIVAMDIEEEPTIDMDMDTTEPTMDDTTIPSSNQIDDDMSYASEDTTDQESE
jgi:hypothetical protein